MWIRRALSPSAASLRPGAHAGHDGEGLGQDSSLVRSEFSTRVFCGAVSLLRYCVKSLRSTLTCPSRRSKPDVAVTKQPFARVLDPRETRMLNHDEALISKSCVSGPAGQRARHLD